MFRDRRQPRFSLTGGLYAYVEVAFGHYVGFLAGMLYFLTALGAVAGVVNVLANSVALVVPFLGSPVMRIIVMFAVYGSLVLINIRGVRQGAGAVTVITLAELLPLLLFICLGIFFVHAPNLAWSGWPSSKSLGDAVILLIFAFVGIEVALIPSGEVKNPARTVPRSAYLALVITTIIYLMIQLVAQGTLGADLANHPEAPLAESAATFLGNLGRMILLAGASISAFGFVTSDILSSPRMIFAFGRDGALPQFFAHVHPRYRSPDVAIIASRALAFALSISGTFEKLAVLSNVAVLLMYLLCCAACWVLVQRNVRSDGEPFNFPGMKIVPALAIVAIIWILAHATVREFLVTAIVLVLASMLYYVPRTVTPDEDDDGCRGACCRASAAACKFLAGQRFDYLLAVLGVSSWTSLERGFTLTPCATIISRSITRSCGFQASRLTTSTRKNWSNVQTGW